jgi:hypothetical protein
VDKLGQAALMLTVAKDSILQITGASRVEINAINYNFEVHILDDKKFSQLAKGRQVEVTEREGDSLYPFEYSFWLHGVKFLVISEERRR